MNENGDKNNSLLDVIEDEAGAMRAVLHQIEALLKSLVETDEGGSIDLSDWSLTNAELELLDEMLGEGEVYAQVDGMGLGEVRETGIAGVWWITHRNEDGVTVAEFIEVSYCPALVMPLVEDVRESWEALRARLLEAEYLSK